LAGADAPAVFPGVMHHEHGELVATLQLAQVSEAGLPSPLAFSSVQKGSRISSRGC
jgi:hypothetical protein